VSLEPPKIPEGHDLAQKCWFCGEPIQPGMTTCKACGAEVRDLPAEPPPATGQQDPVKKCPFCAETIKADAIVCRFCGRDVRDTAPAEIPVQRPNRLAVVQRILVSIVLTLGLVSLVSLVVVVVGVIGVFRSCNALFNEAVVAPERQLVSDITWDQLNKTFRMMGHATEFQRDEKWKEFAGKKVKWTGTVLSVKDSWGLTLILDVAHFSDYQLENYNPYESLLSTVEVDLNPSERPRALSLNAGDVITVIGVLDISPMDGVDPLESEKAPLVNLKQGTIALPR
jgi:uncharacterized protein with PIN domain